MDQRTLLRLSGALLLALLIGFLPPWLGKRSSDRKLAETRLELELSREQGRLGAALTEALRSNYERSRQLMAAYFTELQATVPKVEDPHRRQALTTLLGQRDELITMLSRAQPETAQRLMLLYTGMFTATDPQGTVGSAVTPVQPPAPAATGPAATPPSAPGPAPATRESVPAAANPGAARTRPAPVVPAPASATP